MKRVSQVLIAITFLLASIQIVANAGEKKDRAPKTESKSFSEGNPGI
ncbi:MAG: hypothetical protein RL189_2025 [Pseudomonadota bacterium]|jgi:hypothetical protein